MTMNRRDQEEMADDTDDNHHIPNNTSDHTDDDDYSTDIQPEVTTTSIEDAPLSSSSDHSKRRERVTSTTATAAASLITSSSSSNNNNNGNNTSNGNNNGNNNENTRLLNTTSQHTEIEFYSSDDDIENEEDDSFIGDTDDNDDEDDNDDHSSEVPEVDGPHCAPRPSPLQRGLSMQSISSDAYSLPLGAQDDVSSLESDDNVLNVGVDDISLDGNGTNEDKEKTQKQQQQQQQPKKKPMVVIDMSEKSPVPTNRKSADPTTRLLLGRISPLLQRKASISHLRLEFLPEVVDEDEHDDADNDNAGDDEERSIGFHDLLQASNSSADDDHHIDDVTRRLHKSLFIPPTSTSLTILHMPTAAAADASFNNHTPPQGQIRKRGGAGSVCLSMADDDDDYDRLAKNLPPELDLNLARKYIAQLAEGVPDVPPVCDSLDEEQDQIMISQATETLDQAEMDKNADSLLPTTPKNYHAQRVNTAVNNTPQESLLSYDFTEVVYGSADEYEIDDEELIIEEVIHEEEEEVIIYEEEEEVEEVLAAAAGEFNDPSLPTPAALTGMVGMTS